ncbi:THUMP domain-containing class I SAM-dependent RNA methyltransferase [Fusobacterium sp. PH5-44]|uniref:THUMP domain-containing class I SAM-dependent RNA methyltransferase n=1 Tax=unclassified Fusobacterium TaxID=2648384 RepID=UPI003D2087A4
MTLIASTTMGLEAIVRDECISLGFDNVRAFDGRVEFDGTMMDIPIGNINLRCADRLYVKMGEFNATTFEELFQNIKRINWEKIIDVDGEFPISWVSSVKSKLYSKSDIQRITKKAIVEKLKEKYSQTYFSEKGAKYAIKIQAIKDNFIVMIDTSGEALHKRGYRMNTNEAPLKETLAAALVKLSRWNGGSMPLLDPMCGSGTIAIEGAMIARNIAPGANRNFASEKWDSIADEYWINARDIAYSKEDNNKEVIIYASDIDEEAVKLALLNAKKAGVDSDITFQHKSILEIEIKEEYGHMITNPPYGERLLDIEKSEKLYGLLGDICRMRLKKWSYYIITPDEKFEKCFEKKSTKNRKLYNGGMKCYYYQYYGEKPSRC